MEENFLYFFITYTRKKKEEANDIDFVDPEKSELKPECIYLDEQYKDEEQLFYYNKIFKVSKSSGKGKKRNNFYFEFEINDEKFIISFDSKGKTFIYEVSLEVGKKIIDIRRKINQNKDYYKTIEYFIKALKKKGKESIIDNLYKETIELYSKKKGFTFMIVLFLNIYEKKNLCSELMKIFKEINGNPKDNEKNMDRKSFLKDFLSQFKEIKTQADTIIKNNDYEPIEFYGILLCYFNYYDQETFASLLNKFPQEPKILYEILLIYNAHFKYPINQNLDFLNKFIIYAIANRDFSVFEKGLNYILDIETFLNIIEKNKEAILEKYNAKRIIKLDDLKFKKKTNKIDMEDESQITKDITIEGNESNTNSKKIIKQSLEEFIPKIKKEKHKSIYEVIGNITSIIDFCKKKKTFLIYFTNNFWQYILNYYNEPKMDNIKICFELRKIFVKYHDLVIEVFEKKDPKYTIKKEAINYFQRDEFAFLLDQIIRKYNNNPDVINIEKLAFITKYNPYYIEPKYSNKIDCAIFDSFDINTIDNEFIGYFREMDFEKIFKDNISEYIKKFFEKIKNIQNLDTIIKLINIKKIEKKDLYLDSLKKRYDIIISDKIGSLENEKLNEAVYVVAKIAIISYVYREKKKKFEFIKKLIKELDRKVIPLIFIEIINLCFNKEDKDDEKEVEEDNDIDGEEKKKRKEVEDQDIDFKEMKEFIFTEFSNKLVNEKDIENIINLIDCLEGKNKKKKEENINGKNGKDKKKE